MNRNWKLYFAFVSTMILLIGISEQTLATDYIAIDLDPGGFYGSSAFGIGGGQQVGYGSLFPMGINGHALLWSGSAASVVDLNPSGFSDSAPGALAVDSSWVTAVDHPRAELIMPCFGAVRRQALWTLIPAALTDLRPGALAAGNKWVMVGFRPHWDQLTHCFGAARRQALWILIPAT